MENQKSPQEYKKQLGFLKKEYIKLRNEYDRLKILSTNQQQESKESFFLILIFLKKLKI